MADETSIDVSKKQEVIDGQQRLTTLFPLLRALYKKLGYVGLKSPYQS